MIILPEAVMRVLSGSASAGQGREKWCGELQARRSCMIGFWSFLCDTSFRALATMSLWERSSASDESSDEGLEEVLASICLKYSRSLTSL